MHEGKKEFPMKEGRRSGSRNSLSSTGCKNGSSFTKELVRFFPGQAFRYRGKSERKTKLCVFTLGSIGDKKKIVVIEKVSPLRFLHFFFWTKSARSFLSYSMYIYIIWFWSFVSREIFNKFVILFVNFFKNYR